MIPEYKARVMSTQTKIAVKVGGTQAVPASVTEVYVFSF